MAESPQCTPFSRECGYDYDYVDAPPQSLTCPICLLPFRKPIILDCCGARYCEVCITPIMEDSSPTCPLCRNSFRSLVDKQALRQVQDLRVRCSRKSEGCNWEGEMRALEIHEKDECEWNKMVCPYGCGARFTRRQAQEHYCLNQPLEARMEGLIHSFNAELASTKQAHQSELTSLRSEFKQELERRDKVYQEKLKRLEKECAELKGHLFGFLPIPPCMFTMPDYTRHKKAGDVWFSRPFHSGPGGYKMCLAVTAFGIGTGKSSHVTVGVYLMKGEHDDHLAWPFRATITVQLLNQKEGQEIAEDVKGVIKFDKAAGVSAERVKYGERTKQGWGNHTFVSHNQVEAVTDTTQYIVDDSLTLRVAEIVMLK